MVLFVCDAMLGELARWFRILGLSTFYVPNTWSDDEVLSHLAGMDPKATLVTRDRALHQRAQRQGASSLHVVLDTPTEEALRRAITRAAVSLDPSRLFTICSLCNGPLRQATDAEIASVPDQAQERHDEFRTCTRCSQVYWRGSHWKGILEMWERVKGPSGHHGVSDRSGGL